MKSERIRCDSLLSFYGFNEGEIREYPIISGILKELTPEKSKEEIAKVCEVELPPEIQNWVEGYKRVGERNELIWKWIFKVTSSVTLPTVEKEYCESLPSLKAVLFMFDVLVDDIADKNTNPSLLRELLKIPFYKECINLNTFSAKEKEYFLFTQKTWEYIENTAKNYPRYNELRQVFEHDVAQLCNTMRYSHLVNVFPYVINRTEFWSYLPPNMTVMICSTIDLMCSPKVKNEELGRIREVFWLAQEMARIGNWVSTWERELKEKDFTSGVWAYALNRKIINIDELKEGGEEVIRKLKQTDIERTLLCRWEKNYIRITKLQDGIESFNVYDLLLMLKNIIIMHLSSRNYK